MTAAERDEVAELNLPVLQLLRGDVGKVRAVGFLDQDGTQGRDDGGKNSCAQSAAQDAFQLGQFGRTQVFGPAVHSAGRDTARPIGPVMAGDNPYETVVAEDGRT
jgi:hypothetical protein